MKNKLRVSSPWEESESGDHEPFALDSLENWQLRNEILQDFLSHPQPELIDENAMLLQIQKKQNRGEIPRGFMGQKLLQELWAQSQKLMSAVIEKSGGAKRKSINIRYECDISINSALQRIAIVGTINDIYDDKYLPVVASKHSGKILLQHLIQYYLLNLSVGQMSYESELFCSDTNGWLKPMGSEIEAYIINTLVTYFLAGQCKMLPFDPNISYQYALGIKSSIIDFDDDDENEDQVIFESASDGYFSGGLLTYNGKPPKGFESLDWNGKSIALQIFIKSISAFDDLREYNSKKDLSGSSDE